VYYFVHLRLVVCVVFCFFISGFMISIIRYLDLYQYSVKVIVFCDPSMYLRTCSVYMLYVRCNHVLNNNNNLEALH
jgi:hypothetical protein